MRILISFCAFFICVFSFGQNSKDSKKSVKNIDLIIEKGTYEADASFSADKLILNTVSDQDTINKKIIFNENEWIQIKAKITANKQRVANAIKIFTSKEVIDTVYVQIPSTNTQTQLSGW